MSKVWAKLWEGTKSFPPAFRGELWAAGPAWGVLSQLLPLSSLQIATAEMQVHLRADAELVAP